MCRGLQEHYLHLPGQSCDEKLSVSVSIYPVTLPSFFVDWPYKDRYHEQCSGNVAVSKSSIC